MAYDTISYTNPLFSNRCRQMQPQLKQFYALGQTEVLATNRKKVAIIGTRRITPYGKQVTADFASRLAEQGVIIVSGLAYGVDSAAHEACLQAGGQTIAVLPSPVDNVVPVAHHRLAQQITSHGCLLSQYAPGAVVHKGNFVERNQLVAAISDAVLVIEAGEHSGTSHTVDFALELGTEVLVVPGDITKPMSVGTNNMLKSGRAQLVTNVDDVLNALQMSGAPRQVVGANEAEQCILDLLLSGISEGSNLLKQSNLPANEFASTLTMLEITAKVRPLGANYWAIA